MIAALAAPGARRVEAKAEDFTQARWLVRPEVLLAAGVYNLAWGALAILAPEWCFRVVGMEPTRGRAAERCLLALVVVRVGPLGHGELCL